MTYLLDTVTVSELCRGRLANPQLLAWVDLKPAQLLHLSVLTLAEVERGARRLRDGVQRKTLIDWSASLAREFDGRILPVDLEVALRWAQVFGELERQGRRPPLLDSLIAATALVHGLTVVTRNVADFRTCGVEVENPWDIG